MLLCLILSLRASATDSNLLVNGDFEGTAGWSAYPFNQLASITGNQSHSGMKAMLLNWVEESDRNIPTYGQQFAVPSSTAQLKISFWYKTGNADSGLRFRLRESGSGIGLWYHDGRDWTQAPEAIDANARDDWFQGEKGISSKYNTFAQGGMVAEWTQYSLTVPVKAGVTSYCVEFMGRGRDKWPQQVYVDDVQIQFVAEKFGQVTGTVLAQPEGKAVPKAELTLSHLANSALQYSATAQEDGRFTFTNIPADVYELKVVSVGYDPQLRKVLVRDGEAASANVQLKLKSEAFVFWDEAGWIREISMGKRQLLSSAMPWRITFVDGKQVDCPKIGPDWERKLHYLPDGRAEEVSSDQDYSLAVLKREDGEIMRLTWQTPQVMVQLYVTATENSVYFYPTVKNFTETPIQTVSVPVAAILPETGLLSTVQPWWGGQEYTKEYMLKNLDKGTIGGSFPPASHDLGLYRYEDGWLGIYGADRGAPVRFAKNQVSKNERGIGLTHSYAAWIETGQSERIPPTVVNWGESGFAVSEAYAQDSGISDTPRLEEKLGADFAAKLKDSVHMICMLSERPTATFEQWQAFFASEELPDNLLVEFAGFNPNRRFDTRNPDTLPVHSLLGGEDGFPMLVKSMQERGMLVQTYIQANWWNHDSPTFQDAGAGLIGLKTDWRNPDSVAEESYSVNSGIRVQLWRPEVFNVTWELTERLMRYYGVDMIFHDQLGFTLWPDNAWDFDPNRTGKPYRYFQDMVDLAALQAQMGRLSSEGVGNDRVWRYLAASFGHYFRSEGARQWWASGQGRPWPYFYAGSGQTVAFYQHNLQTNTDSDEKVSWQLAMGIGMNTRFNSYMQSFLDGKQGWGVPIRLLAQIQRSVVSAFVGQRMRSFEYLSGWIELTKTSWENGVMIWANHTSSAQKISWQGKEWVLAPFGFLAAQGDEFLGGNLLASSERTWSGPTYCLRNVEKPGELMIIPSAF
jgi:hypothetical protein